MKKSMYLWLLVPCVAANVFQRAACNADNCARAVTGTLGNSASRVSTDCSSFQAVTICPPATTIMQTSGSISTTISPSCVATTTTPARIPAYAQTACSSGNNPSSRFSSACSCAGMTRSTVTATTPTVTIIVPQPTSGATCGQPYATAGKRFTTFCGMATTEDDETNVISRITTTDFAACIDLCAGDDTCVAVNYVKDAGYAARNGYNCVLLTSGSLSTAVDNAHYNLALLTNR